MLATWGSGTVGATLGMEQHPDAATSALLVQTHASALPLDGLRRSFPRKSMVVGVARQRGASA